MDNRKTASQGDLNLKSGARSEANSSPANDLAERIRAVVRRVPAGRVVTYGQVAKLAGAAGRARYVSRCLGERESDDELPWFRVIGAPGRIAFAERSRGWVEQSRRLKAEGVVVVRGRVDLDRFQWQPDQQAPVLD